MDILLIDIIGKIIFYVIFKIEKISEKELVFDKDIINIE